MHTICKLQREQPVYRFKVKSLICAQMFNQLKQLFFRLTTRQPIQPVFYNNINRFM